MVDQERPAGQRFQRAVLVSQLLQTVLLRDSSGLGKGGGIPKSVSSWQYLAQHGYTQVTTYQPASAFWPFQWIEGGWLLALSALLITVTMWLVRRRAT